MVLLRFWVRVSVDAWFNVMPAGMETIIAMQNPNAMITSNALILRLEIFLTALFRTPNYLTLQKSTQKKGATKKEGFERRLRLYVKLTLARLIL